MDAIPPWMNTLANAVAGTIQPVDVLAPIGCHYGFFDGQWEISLFVGTTDVVGGARDGERLTSNFVVDVGHLLALFHEVRCLHWQALPRGADDDLGTHLSLEGTYAGRQVWLRILAVPPEHYPPSRRAHVRDRVWEELW